MAALHSDHYRQVPLVGAGCFRQVAALHSDHYRQVPLVGAGCCRQVAALHSDHYRQVPLVGAGCFRQVAALRSDLLAVEETLFGLQSLVASLMQLPSQSHLPVWDTHHKAKQHYTETHIQHTENTATCTENTYKIHGNRTPLMTNQAFDTPTASPAVMTSSNSSSVP